MRILDRYQLVRILGKGGMGVVWLARDEKLDRDVALKFLPDMVLNDRASLNELMRETRRSLELTHPHIVRTYDFVQDSTVAGISMEYVDSDTLRNLRIDQPGGVFQPSQLGEWTKQLCQALDYAHNQAAIVHRDLKPANLMINTRNQLKIADFGIARSLVESMSQISMRGGVSGTLIYMSPQQLSGEPVNPLDDIYAVGATLYELLTTRPPFYTGDIASQVHAKIPQSLADRRNALGIPAGEISENWESAIASCLAKDPAQRPRSAAEIAVRLGLMPATELTVRTTAVFPAYPAPTPATGSVPPPSGPPTAPSATTATAAGAPATSTAVSPPTLTDVPMTVPPRKGKKGILAGSIALLAISGVLAAMYVSGKSNRPVEPSAEKTTIPQTPLTSNTQSAPIAPVKVNPDARGRLYVESEPSGATLSIDGEPAGVSGTPCPNLKVGEHSLQVDLAGYDPVALTFEVKDGETSRPPMVKLARSVGPLEIITQPDGLACEIKDLATLQVVDKTQTPVHASALPVGKYQVTVSRPGWQPQKKEVTVARNAPQSLAFEFSEGSVMLVSEPAGATVTANGKELGVTPLPVPNLTPGPVSYTVQLKGYDKTTVNGVVEAGQETPLTAKLSKTAAAKAPVKTTASTKPSSSGTRSSSRSRDDDDDRPSSSGSAWQKAATGINMFRAIRGY